MNSPRRSLNWEQVKDRLNRAQTSFERALSAEAATIEDVFNARAAALAAHELHRKAKASVALLTFSIGVERCLLELRELLEIVPMQALARMPGASHEVLGAMNVRGDLWVVADLAALMGLTSDADEAGYALLLRRSSLALRVDRVARIEWLASDDAVFVRAVGEEFSSRHVRGVTEDGAMLLSVDSLMSHAALQSRMSMESTA